MIYEKDITKFEKEVLLQEKIEQLETELKEFSDLQKKAYSPNGFEKSMVGLENSNLRNQKNCFITTDLTVICVYHFQSL